MTLHGLKSDQHIHITEDFSDGTCLIRISVEGLRHICAIAKNNKGKESSDGPIHVKFYRSKQVADLVC